MPSYFRELADYNAEIARGIVHTAEWDARMAKLQSEYFGWLKATSPNTVWAGDVPVPDPGFESR